ncbi:hypothetical protein [Pseudomonas paeninsulae]|nr:hypothetical protein [Pseudomonas sp. IT1137]
MDDDHLPNLDEQLVELPMLERLDGKLTLSYQPRICGDGDHHVCAA